MSEVTSRQGGERGGPVREPIPMWPGELVSVGRTSVFVRSAPRHGGEPALFVHGLAGSATNWTDLMGLLADTVAGEAIDLPGFGYSPPPPDGDYTVDAHARAVAGLIEARDRGPVHLFGNSLGGAVATRVAGARPDLVRTLTLISPALPDFRPRYGSARILVGATPCVGPWLVGRLQTLPAERRVLGTLVMCFADPNCMHPDRITEYVEEVRRRDGLGHTTMALIGSARGIVAQYLRRSLWRDAARVGAPTLLIYGRHDRIIDPRVAARAARVFPEARAVVLPGVGHVAQMERPDLVAREFRALLEDAAPTISRRATPASG